MAEVKRAKRKTTPKDTPIVPLDGRMPPQAVDFEEAVLGAILLEQDAYSRVSEMLTPTSFYVKAHELIYTAMTTLALSQHPIDMLTVTEELRRTEQLELVGGPAYISGLTVKVLSTASLEFHAAVLAKKALSRRLIGFSSEVLKDAYEDTEDIAEQLQRAEGRLFEIAQNNSSKDFSEINPLVKDAVEEIQKAANNKDGLSGITSGFPAIDEMTAGWQRSDLIIIAARPAMGKTAFVVSMAKYMAVDHKIPVALFNLEMSAVQLVKRLLSNVCEISGDKIKSGQLDEQEWARLYTNIKMLDSGRLFINDTPSLSVFELRSKARRLVREHKVQMIIIDYLQLMNASGMGFGNREQEVSMISRSLKMLAKELQIPIIALSQLNRGVENRQGDANSKRPQLSDLRESGAIEQDADIVCFIHRPEYYKITQDEKTGESLRGVAEFIIAKHRNGPVGDVRLTFKSEFAKFSPYQSPSAGNEFNTSVLTVRRSRLGAKTDMPQPTPDFNDPSGSFDPLSPPMPGQDFLP
ncbi:replicative DNA helicase [Porphyromonas sp. COT-290 OH3588]|uniref:replicative DNA helicase n=1 Tax=Porphyromonas sp. COT-290 OH3588 TaxID=1515617 RepID=UPI00052B5EAD|nr:replicative DNA helicase [Porphyromonas sp. COT-290 OH3588]KGN97168.1 DNA helicase [Porphyromonas sp. COT-290 OH3588]